MKHVIGILTILISLLTTAQTVDISKVSTDSEVYLTSKKRGIQSETGALYVVDSKNQTIIHYDADKQVRWKINSIEACGKPAVGNPEIRHIKLSGKFLEVTFGKHSFASVHIQTRKINCLGSD